MLSHLYCVANQINYDYEVRRQPAANQPKVPRVVPARRTLIKPPLNFLGCVPAPEEQEQEQEQKQELSAKQEQELAQEQADIEQTLTDVK